MDSPHASDVTRTLTKRYVLALIVLGVLATISLLGIDFVISRQEGAASLINVAGRQRMRSQRAVIYAARLTSDSAGDRERARLELIETANKLEGRHAALVQEAGAFDISNTSGEMTPALRRIYFFGSDAIDPLMQKFLAASRSLARKAESGPIPADDPELALVNHIGTTQLLSALDQAVGYYEAQSESAVRNLRLIEVIIWLAGLTVLLATALLVFAPMVRRLRENLNEAAAMNARLAESEERFALAAQGSSAGICDQSDVRRDEEYWSPHLYQLLGYMPGELPARATSISKLVHPQDRQRYHDELARHLEEHTPLQLECRLKHKTHGYRWFQVTGQATWTADDRPRRLITTFKDIDERVQMQRMKSEFVSTVSHELRTPLTSIMGALGLLRSSAVGQLSEKAQHLVTVAFENGDRLVRLINDILDVEKIEAGKIAFDFKPESLRHLLMQAKEENELFAEQHGATIVIEPVAQDVMLEVDNGRFAQVMANLLSNAAKYSPPGGKIKVAAQVLDGAVRVTVSDEGPGIPEEFREHIFERFAQARMLETRTKGGTGLGLNIAKAIVEAHNGTIGFNTTDGEGTTFYFELPTVQSDTQHAPALEAGADIVGIPTQKADRQRFARILIVLPDAAARARVSGLLGDISEVTEVVTTAEARPLLARRAFDLVVFDSILLGNDGKGLLDCLSGDGRPVPPVLVYSRTASDAAPLPTCIASVVRGQVDELAMRRTVVDELRLREDQLATRFKKSA